MSTSPRLTPDFSGVDAAPIVACSGGPDSVALLVLAAEAGLDPTAVYVDHGLRADCSGDLAAVRAAADRLGVPWRSIAVTVGDGANLEARARDLRYQALREVAADVGATRILVGHTADDQAETVILNLLRGSASAGLAGMARVRDDIVRPLLHERRAMVREFLAARGFDAVEDPMNADRGFRRVWIREEVIPMLNAGAARDVVPILARQADLLRAESELMDSLGAELLRAAGDGDALRVGVLVDAPVVLARRAIRQWLGSPPPAADEVDRVLAVVRGDCVATELVGGQRVHRSTGRISRSGKQALP
ncbi:MAG: tRNA lysidine(34) synthetase TilS [Acidimicrobiia bacterium]|nr:tRNA lysidine(34) synthetase TilS [Acidimicrobiia bacterium]